MPGVPGALEYFLKLDTIQGDSLDDKHKGEINVLSFSWGVTREGVRSSGAGREGRAVPATFQIVKGIDRASPALFTSAATGVHLKEASFVARRSSQKGSYYPFMIKLADVIVTDYSTGSSPTGDATEQIKLSFAKIQMDEYSPLPDGRLAKTSAGYDFVKMTKF